MGQGQIPRILCNPAIVFEHAWIALEKCRAGALIECGCCEGFTSVFLRFGLRKFGSDFRQYAADTFAGFPENYACRKKHKAGTLAPTHGNFTVSELEKMGIVVLRGRVEETLAQIPKTERFFFMFLDLDAHEPTEFTWNVLKSRVLPGGRVGFHDYGTQSLAGITRLCDKIAKIKGWQEVAREGKGARDAKFIFFEKE